MLTPGRLPEKLTLSICRIVISGISWFPINLKISSKDSKLVQSINKVNDIILLEFDWHILKVCIFYYCAMLVNSFKKWKISYTYSNYWEQIYFKKFYIEQDWTNHCIVVIVCSNQRNFISIILILNYCRINHQPSPDFLIFAELFTWGQHRQKYVGMWPPLSKNPSLWSELYPPYNFCFTWNKLILSGRWIRTFTS